MTRIINTIKAFNAAITALIIIITTLVIIIKAVKAIKAIKTIKTVKVIKAAVIITASNFKDLIKFFMAVAAGGIIITNVMFITGGG